ncbi:unnamed protein product [Amoebophrya sp. A25]|nr:unnamed protein product [Amoebophrya sp. A25]|eukprot:GSA25T00013067001.1
MMPKKLFASVEVIMLATVRISIRLIIMKTTVFVFLVIFKCHANARLLLFLESYDVTDLQRTLSNLEPSCSYHVHDPPRPGVKDSGAG